MERDRKETIICNLPQFFAYLGWQGEVRDEGEGWEGRTDLLQGQEDPERGGVSGEVWEA